MKSGYVAVIGRANAGKSTLINVLVGEKVSIVSPKPQTTRDRIIGIYNDEDSQIVFVDTPGIYGADNFLSSVMQKTAEDAANDVDLTLIVCDAHEGLSEKDLGVVKKFVKENAVVALTKTDITTENLLISAINDVGGSGAEIVPVSARKGKNLKELLKVIKAKLPEGERIFPLDVISDRSEKFMIAEIMREKILLKCDKEIPHGVAVIVNEFKLREDGKVYDINLDVICEKQNHKAIIIGKGGGRIKEISSFARTDMEKFLGKKVFLTTFVKVKEDWRNSERLVKEHGYAE
ncbi:MAG: GTPase Era [Clostridia bacterium]|nr:GTPase Era [Clostridia bacterium]MBR5388300.1 GTPase Era [Clostridia bacterium]